VINHKSFVWYYVPPSQIKKVAKLCF